MRARQKGVHHLVIETAFGDDGRPLARISRHLCPATLGHELAQLGGPLNASVNVYIAHIKPGEMDAVMAEIALLATPHKVQALVAGQVMQLGAKSDRPPPSDEIRR